MKITLSGYNVDTNVLAELKAGKHDAVAEHAGIDSVTPEVISAAYARISRDPRPVGALRVVARNDVEDARKSNQRIVFDMGHSSVAEHAALNFDVEGISRLAIEVLELHRLCSFTERSQRYVTQKARCVIPPEIKGTAVEHAFLDLVQHVQNAFYFDSLEPLEQWHTQNPATSELLERMGIVPTEFKSLEAYEKRKKQVIEGWAKEDARYGLGLSAQGQLGLTANARNLEYVIRCCKAHPLAEIQEMGQKLYEEAHKVVPSLVRHLDNPFLQHYRADLQQAAAKFMPSMEQMTSVSSGMLDHNKIKDNDIFVKVRTLGNQDVDMDIICALLESATGIPASALMENLYIQERSFAAKAQLVKDVLQHLGQYDTTPRELEQGVFAIDAVVSSSCFAQLKRHRMASLFPGRYDPNLGITVPESVREAGLEPRLRNVAKYSEELYADLSKQYPAELGLDHLSVADYCLTNAHRRGVHMQMSLRSLYHFARLRCDGHAQWDIRGMAEEVCHQVINLAPLTSMLLCGKDQFDVLRKDVYE